MLILAAIAAVAFALSVSATSPSSETPGLAPDASAPAPGAPAGKAQFKLPPFAQMMKWARAGNLKPICTVIEADAAVAARAGYSLPQGWEKLPCEAKILFAAPPGIGEAIVGAAKAVQGYNAVSGTVSTAAQDVGDEAQRVYDQAKRIVGHW